MASKEIKTNLSNNELDDLKLTDTILEIPKDIIFPNELNSYLKEQIQSLVYEKGKLQKNLNEIQTELSKSNSEIKSLKSHLKQYEQICIPTVHHANATTTFNYKIVELSKQLREKNCELEKFKTKCSKLEQIILELKRSTKDENEIKENKNTVPDSSNDLENKIKYLQDNLNFTKAKLCEAKNLNLKLKNDLKQANKYLLQEVGENLETLQKNSRNGNTNWRGRAQIICDLQQKNSDLKEKLKVYQEKEQGKSDSSMKQDNKRLDIVLQEKQELKENFEEIKKKMDAVRARCKVYESENVMLKAKLSALTEQNDRHSKLIAQLTAQASEFHEKQNDILNEKQKAVFQLEKEKKNLELKLSKDKCSIENLQKEMEMKMKYIEELKHEMETKKNLSYYDSTNSDIRKLEGERVRLLELTELLNERLEKERDSHFKTQSNYLFERQRAAKLESKLARIMAEGKTTNRTFNYSYCSSRTYTNNSIEELENRLELANETIKSLETKLQVEQEERKSDIEQFTNILKIHNFNFNNDWDE